MLGVINILFFSMPHLFASETTMIEPDDTTQLAVVPSEPSEAVNEKKKKQCAQNVVFNNVRQIM